MTVKISRRQFKMFSKNKVSIKSFFKYLFIQKIHYFLQKVYQSCTSKVNLCLPSHISSVQLFATLWTVAFQVPLSMGFSSQEYWIGLPFPPQGNLPNLEIEPTTLMSLALAGGFFTTSVTWEEVNTKSFNIVCCCCLNVLLFATPWTIALQVFPVHGILQQECLGGLSLPSPGDLPNPGIKLRCLASPASHANSLSVVLPILKMS